MKSQSERVLDYRKKNGSILVLDEFLGIIGLPSIIYDLRKAGYQIGCARRSYGINGKERYYNVYFMEGEKHAIEANKN